MSDFNRRNGGWTTVGFWIAYFVSLALLTIGGGVALGAGGVLLGFGIHIAVFSSSLAVVDLVKPRDTPK